MTVYIAARKQITPSSGLIRCVCRWPVRLGAYRLPAACGFQCDALSRIVTHPRLQRPAGANLAGRRPEITISHLKLAESSMSGPPSFAAVGYRVLQLT